jgi:hypothetical protein
MFSRARVDGSGLGERSGPGQPLLSQITSAANATAASATLTAEQILSGHLRRSGPGVGFTDTWPTADSIIAAMLAGGCGPQVGDCFQFIYQNLTALAMTFAAGTGIVSGTGTLNVAASVTRLYYHTLLSTKPTVVLVGNADNAGDFIFGLTAAQVANVMPGMGVSGTGIGAGALVLGVIPDAGRIQLVAGDVTADGTNLPFTFFPRIRLDSIGVLAA